MKKSENALKASWRMLPGMKIERTRRPNTLSRRRAKVGDCFNSIKSRKPSAVIATRREVRKRGCLLIQKRARIIWRCLEIRDQNGICSRCCCWREEGVAERAADSGVGVASEL